LAGNDLAAYEKVLALKPGLAEAWLGCGNVFVDLKRYDKAFPAFDRALALKPDLISVEGSRLFVKMNICDWSNLEAEAAHLIASVRNGHVSTSPFPFLIVLIRRPAAMR
jgi:protein O-GlcNAc transferase